MIKENCNKIAKAVGFAGGLLCLIAVFGRFKGPSSILGCFQAINVMITGIALMVFSCMHALVCTCCKKD